MKTIVVDILTDKAEEHLRDLENQNLIRMHEQKMNKKATIDWVTKYKGAMTQQSISDVDRQLNELRNGWE